MDQYGTLSILGTVISVQRGAPDGTLESELLTLTIENDTGKNEVDLPIATRTAFDVIPYQLAFTGICARYTKARDPNSTSWALELLSGPLNDSYTHREP